MVAGISKLQHQAVSGVRRRRMLSSVANVSSRSVLGRIIDQQSNWNGARIIRQLLPPLCAASTGSSGISAPRWGGVSISAPSNAGCRRWASQGTLSASNHATTPPIIDDESDPYDKYRQRKRHRLSPHILAELQLETLHTQRRIDPKLLEQTQNLVYNAWKQQQQQNPRPEYGPTGTWVYEFAAADNDSSDATTSGRRIYQRYWQGDRSSSQVVLELEPDDEVLSLSLTVDESCIACLVESASTGRRQVRLRHIESDHQGALEYVGDGSLYTSLVGLEWGPMLSLEGGDVHSLYFVGTDELGRPDRVLVSTVHSTVLHVEESHLVIQSNDPAEMVDVQRTKGCQYVSIHLMTKTSNEIYLSQGPNSLELVLPRQESVQYHLDVGEKGDIVMLLSHGGGDYRLLETSVWSLPMDPASLGISDSTTARDKIITDMDLFRDYLVLYEKSTKTGIPQITLQNRNSQDASHSVTIPLTMGDRAPCMQVAPAGNVWFGAHTLNLLVETPVMPPANYELDFASNELRHVGGIDPTTLDYQQERVMVSSSDGTQIPLSVLYRKDSNDLSTSIWSWFGSSNKSEKSNQDPKPIVLIGYGSYGESVNMGFDPALVPLLESGHVLAFAHTRGGGEMGNAWYHAGRHLNKPKVVQDFIACAEYLRNRWEGPLTAKGYSAAGVMIGAAVNQRPELFGNLILTNPFLDVYVTMTNPDLYLTAHEWDEFGNPRADSEVDQVIRSYCPVQNVAPNTEEYPRCLLIGTLDDEHVPFWNPTIFAKKVRDHMTRTAKDKVFLHIEETGGHHLGQRRLDIAAMELAFIFQDTDNEIGKG